MRTLKDLLADLAKSGLTLEQQLLLMDLINECRRVAVWRDTREIDEALDWLRNELDEASHDP